jgi:hypothetical protein
VVAISAFAGSAVARTPTLSGAVFGGGAPLANATVEALTNGTTSAVAQSTTDTSGHYALAVQPGTYDLRVTPPAGSGFGQEIIQDIEVTADRQYDVILLSSGATGVSGTVRGLGGEPIGGANVYAYSSDSGQFLTSTTTGADGHYSLALSAGSLRLDFFSNGAASTIAPRSWTWRRYNVPVSGSTTLNVDLPVVVVSGRTLDPNGNAVGGVAITANANSYDSSTQTQLFVTDTATSDAAGAYRVLMLTGTATFTLRPPASSNLTVLSVPNVSLTGDLSRDFVLPEPLYVSGTVRGLGSQPIGAVNVSAFSNDSGQFLTGATTDASGHYSLALSAGSIRLDFSSNVAASTIAPRSWTYRRYNLSVNASTTFDLDLPVVVVSGRTVDSSHDAVAAVAITATANSYDGVTQVFVTENATSDAAGAYRLLMLKGTASFTIRPPASSNLTVLSVPNVNLTADLSRDFVLPQPISVSGTVRGIGGQPIGGVSVSAYSAETGQFLTNATTDASGHYSLPLSAGSIRLDFSYNAAVSTIAPRSWTYRRYNVAVSGNTTADFDVPVVRLAGTAIDSNGAPVPNVRVQGTLNSFDSATQTQWFLNESVVSDAAGSYALLLVRGSAQLQVFPPSGSGFAPVSLGNVPLTGNLTQRIVMQRPDTTAPVIVTKPVVVHLSDTSVSVGWTTDEPATSVVDFGLDALSTTLSSNTLSTSHSVTLQGLDPTAIYTYQVSSVDRSGNGPVKSGIGFFKTQAPPGDITPPVILAGPSIAGLSDRSAIVQWRTDEPATSAVEFGIDPSFGSLAEGVAGSFTSSHSLVVSPLAPSTTYYARVHSVDPDGNAVTSSTISFTTVPQPDVQPPVIQNLSAVSVTDHSITLEWTTNEAASSAVSANDGTAFFLADDPALVTNHRITLTGLAALRAYNVTVSSKDAAGNGPTLAGPISVATLAAPDTAAPVNNVLTVDAAKRSATLTWTTNEPASVEVRYGTVADNLDGLVADLSLVTAHTVLLTGLTPSTPYFGSIVVTDAAGNATQRDFEFTTLADNIPVPPTPPSPLTVSKTPNATGTFVITWGASTDDGPGGVKSYEVFRGGTSIATLAADVTSYSEADLPEGDYNYRIKAADYDGLTSESADLLVVVDRTAPELDLPAGVDVPATTNTDALVKYVASATDNRDAAPVVSCVPASGTAFVIGETSVTCTATDAAGNTATGSFTVTVRDPFPPILTVPAPIRVDATAFSGAVVSYSATAADNADPNPVVSCDPASGTLFAVGVTTVVCTATDSANNTATKSFTVTVVAPPKAATGTTVTVAPQTPVYGEQVTLAAEVVSSAGGLTGSVEFLDGTTLLGRATIDGTPAAATLVTSSLSIGAHSISARYLGDAAHDASVSGTVALSVSKAKPIVTATGGAFTYDGQPHAATGAAHGINGEDLGPVTFTYNDAPDAPVNAGTYAVVATFAGSDTYESATAAATLVIEPAATTTALAVSTANAVFGQPIAWTVTVAPPAGSAVAVDGVIDLLIDGARVATAPLTSGAAEIRMIAGPDLSLGTHGVTAEYRGTPNFVRSASAGVGVVVGPASTSTSLVAAPAPAVFGQPVTLTAAIAVLAPGAGVPGGTIEFADGTVVIGTANLDASGRASLANIRLAVGAHALSARYPGTAPFTTSASAPLAFTVNRASTATALTASSSTVGALQPLVLTARVDVQAPGEGVPAGSVQFLDGATVIGTAPLSVAGDVATASLSTSSLAPGQHTLTASYLGDARFVPSTSPAAVVTVNSLAQSTTTSLTLPSSALVNTPVTIDALVRASAGSAQPTGFVQFYDGSTLLGTSPLALVRGQMHATVTVAFAAIGGHQIVATYVPNGTMAPSTSVPMSITIYATPADAPRATTTQLTVPSFALAGTPVTISATVTVSGPKTTPTGTVDFYIDGVFAGRGTLSAGATSLTVSSLVRGLHRIVAVYSGAAGLAGSTSTEVTVAIW